MSPHDRFDELATACVFGTLDERERRDFDAHAVDCPECQGTVAELRRVAGAVGLAAAAAPPPELRARVLRHATAQPQLSAKIAGTAQESHAPLPLARSRSSRWMPLVLAASVLLAILAGVYAAALRGQVARLSQLVQQASAQLVTLRAELAAARLTRRD